MKLATVGNGAAIHLQVQDDWKEITHSDGRVIPAHTVENTACGAVERGGNALYGHRRRRLNVFEGELSEVTCQRCKKSDAYAAAAEQAAAPAPAAEPTIEALETEMAAANAAEEAALMSGAAPEVLRAARARFYAAHDALHDARREQHLRDRGYDDTAEQAPAAAEQPAAAAEQAPAAAEQPAAAAEQAPAAAELSAAAAELPPHAALEMALHQSHQLANAALEAAKHTRTELEKFFATEAGGKFSMLAQAEMLRAAANAYNAARTAAAEAYDALFVFQHPEAD